MEEVDIEVVEKEVMIIVNIKLTIEKITIENGTTIEEEIIKINLMIDKVGKAGKVGKETDLRMIMMGKVDKGTDSKMTIMMIDLVIDLVIEVQRVEILTIAVIIAMTITIVAETIMKITDMIKKMITKIGRKISQEMKIKKMDIF